VVADFKPKSILKQVRNQLIKKQLKIFEVLLRIDIDKAYWVVHLHAEYTVRIGPNDVPGADIAFNPHELIKEDPIEYCGVAPLSVANRDADVLVGMPEFV